MSGPGIRAFLGRMIGLADRPGDDDDLRLYPLFTGGLLDLLGRLVPTDRLDRIATSSFIRARKPAPGEALPGRASLDSTNAVPV